MSGLKSVGAPATSGTDLVTKLGTDDQFEDAPVSQDSVVSLINTAVSGLASQVSVNNALTAFVQSGYILAQSALLMPATQVGIPGGVATLNSSGDIPTVQTPALGAGYISGPYGPTATYTASASNVPVKIMDWNLGTGPQLNFQPMVFCSLLASGANGGRPVIEVRISAGANTYANQTLIARGEGRSCWNDESTVTILPVPTGPGVQGGSGFPVGYNIWITAWLYDANGQSVSVNTSNIANAGVYLMRRAA